MLTTLKTQSVTKWTWSGTGFVRESPGEKQPAAPNCRQVYKRARYYDTSTGEFISRDSLEYVDGMSQYRGYYVPGLVDPLGTRVQEKDKQKPNCGGNCTSVDDFEGSISLTSCPIDCLQFASTNCKKGCKCSDTQSGLEGSGGKQCKDLLKAAAEAVKELTGGNVKLGRFYCSKQCGGTNYGLTCWRDIGGGRLEIGVCIPTGRKISACEVKALIAHEITHVRDIINVIKTDGIGGLRGIDRDEFEKRAYTQQCSVYADQQCLKEGEREGFIRTCVNRLVGLSTDPENVKVITGGCKKFRW